MWEIRGGGGGGGESYFWRHSLGLKMNEILLENIGATSSFLCPFVHKSVKKKNKKKNLTPEKNHIDGTTNGATNDQKSS